MFFGRRNFQSILEKGFLNQHQTGRSSAAYSPIQRVRAEDRLTGISMGNSTMALELRPKSTFLNIRSDANLAEKNHSITDLYGGIGAVLKPEVKERALWIASDSLDLGTSLGLDFSGKSLVPHRGTFFRDSLPCKSKCSSYYEALTYGSISFSDVDYFLVNVVNGTSSAEMLKVLGKPIYEIKRERRNGRVIFKKGQLLFEGEESSETEGKS